MNRILNRCLILAVGLGLLLGIYAEVDACTRILWNTNPDLIIVGRNEDYVTAQARRIEIEAALKQAREMRARGEDLASLLRRIGRLPRDKAIQAARQICAGLGAAQDPADGAWYFTQLFMRPAGSLVVLSWVVHEEPGLSSWTPVVTSAAPR